MTKVDYITLAIPAFLALMALEWWISKRKGIKLYSLGDSVANVGTGIMDVSLQGVCKLGLLGAYYYVFKHFSLIHFPMQGHNAWIVWVAGFIGSDFLYYWWHRHSHEVNFLWAGHAVHHQSQEYNLSVSLRQCWINNLTAGVYYLPLAILGIPLEVFFAMKSFMIIYQFWIHTRLIGKLGAYEILFNTPSHHRVHHGINPIYIDKNYGGTFIIWDRLFRTFEMESEEPVYGTVKPLASFSSVWAYFQYWVSLAELARQCSRFSDKVKVWFMHPGWKPAELGPILPIPQVDARTFVKYEKKLDPRVKKYLYVQFLLTMLGTTLFLFNKMMFSYGERWGIVCTIILSVGVMGWIADGRLKPRPAKKHLSLQPVSD